MASVTDCLDECQFTTDETGRALLRLAPDGGIVCDAETGLRVDIPEVAFSQHIFFATPDAIVVPEPLNTGIINPSVTAPGGTPVTSVMSGSLHAVPDGDTYAVRLEAHANMFLQSPVSASQCSLELVGSLDGGANYKPLHNQSYFRAGGSEMMPSSWQQWSYDIKPSGSTFTPLFIINYLHNSGDDADFLKATYLQYSLTFHRYT